MSDLNDAAPIAGDSRPVSPMEPGNASTAWGQIQKVRHEIVRRTLTVSAVESLSPGMRRIHLSSPELANFISRSPDDHIKLFLDIGEETPAMRDYTPRSFDLEAGTLAIDFALHAAGPATAWALSAKIGDRLQVAGPRGSAIIPDVFDWYLLVGDETALPAIGRRLEELRAGVPVTTIVAVDSRPDIQAFDTAARWTGEWICRDTDGADDVANAMRAIDRFLPLEGEGFIWIAGEAQFAKSLRAFLIDTHHHPIGRIKAAGYWVRGGEGKHQPLD